MADRFGDGRVVGTRDCTLQRRYQKLVEEAPAPFLTVAQRIEIEKSATAICAEAGYVGAGTVEFLLAPSGALSFLEVDTRLQVEHSATEESTGLDLVRAQLLIAAGHPLDEALGSEQRTQPRTDPRPATRHAIEFRINVEDPARGFAPSTGVITGFVRPDGPGIRLDSGVTTGSVVGGQFDSLLAKLVVSGRDWEQVLDRARRALAEFEITGVRTTLPFVRTVLDDPAFTAVDGFAVHTAGSRRSTCPVRPTPPPPTAGWPYRSATRRAEQASDDVVSSPMQGTLTRLHVADGARSWFSVFMASTTAIAWPATTSSPRTRAG